MLFCIFLDNVVTIINKDWEKIKDSFEIPENILELEKRGIQFCYGKRKIVKNEIKHEIQSDLF